MRTEINFSIAAVLLIGLVAVLPAYADWKQDWHKTVAAAEKEGIRAKTLLRETLGGPAADSIVRDARRQRADLIVLGTHGRRGLRRMVLGSDAEAVVRTSPVPVLLVRSAK